MAPFAIKLKHIVDTLTHTKIYPSRFVHADCLGKDCLAEASSSGFDSELYMGPWLLPCPLIIYLFARLQDDSSENLVLI